MYRKPMCRLGVILGVVFFLAPTIRAEMIIRSASRTISAGGTQLTELLNTSESLGGYSDDLLNTGYIRDDSGAIVGSVSSSASISSTITSTQIRGLGRGSGFATGPGNGLGAAEMVVEFSIEKSTQFSLSGQLRMAPHGSGSDLNGSEAYVRLLDSNGDVAFEVIMDDESLPDGFGLIDFSGGNSLSGVFPAGNYTLEAITSGHGSNGLTRCADFEFAFTALDPAPIPEPTAVTLLCVGLLFVGRLRQRRRK